MSFASKHNKGAIDWGIDTKDFEYYSLADLRDMAGDDNHLCCGLFINSKNNSEYGPSVVLIMEDKFVNLPSHMLDEVKEILSDPEDVEAIKNGKVGFDIREYESHKKKCLSISWIDID